jgi:hypothetical protein
MLAHFYRGLFADQFKFLVGEIFLANSFLKMFTKLATKALDS